MAKLKVDGKEIEVPDHYTLLQAAEQAGVRRTAAEDGLAGARERADEASRALEELLD